MVAFEVVVRIVVVKPGKTVAESVVVVSSAPPIVVFNEVVVIVVKIVDVVVFCSGVIVKVLEVVEDGPVIDVLW